MEPDGYSYDKSRYGPLPGLADSGEELRDEQRRRDPFAGTKVKVEVKNALQIMPQLKNL